MTLTARIAFAVILAVPFFWGLGAEEFHGDESHWVSSGRRAWWLVTSGRWGDAEWKEEFYFYSQPQVGKLLLGAAQAAVGIAGESPIYDYDWQRLPHENAALGRVPDGEALLAARVPGAVLGWVGCLLLWWLASALGAPAAGPIAALLLASQPLWLTNARRAGLDVPALTLGLASAAAALQALHRRPLRAPVPPPVRPAPVSASIRPELASPSVRPELVEGPAPSLSESRGPCASTGSARTGVAIGPLSWWLAAGTLAGLAVGIKYVAVLAVAAVLSPFLAHVRSGSVEQSSWAGWQRGLAGAALGAAAALVVFVGANPAFWPYPLRGLNVSLGFLSGQAEGMRHTVPAFNSPLWVAAQMIDRVFWPLGGPIVVERSMPEPLRPGTYGTPVVALGVLVGLLWLRRRAVGLGQAAVWCAVVFVALAVSLPTWWERWHLPLVPPLVLLAALGLDRLPVMSSAARGHSPAGDPSRLQPLRPFARARVPLGWLLAGAQYVAALSLLPSYLGKGFGQLVFTPVGAVAHLGALAWTLATLVSLASFHIRSSGEKQDGGADQGGTRHTRGEATLAGRDHRDGRHRGRAHHRLPEDRGR